MPGRRQIAEKTVLVQVRITKAEAAAWREHVKKREGYLSSMVRSCVNAHIAQNRGPSNCRHWD